jgi:hypothetical protein
LLLPLALRPRSAKSLWSNSSRSVALVSAVGAVRAVRASGEKLLSLAFAL